MVSIYICGYGIYSYLWLWYLFISTVWYGYGIYLYLQLGYLFISTNITTGIIKYLDTWAPTQQRICIHGYTHI